MTKGLANQPRVFGGASRDRTGDLLHAMQALSQLSYSPSRGALLYRPATSRVKQTRYLSAQPGERHIQALQGLLAPEQRERGINRR